MKKIIIVISICFLSFISISFTSAASTVVTSKIDNNIYKLYKQAILTRHQIQVDYSD
jgi:hypothetical protein